MYKPSAVFWYVLVQFPQIFDVVHKSFCCSSCDVSRHGAAGEASIQTANEERFQQRVKQLFTQFKQQRLTSAALQCEQLINKASEQLTQVDISAVCFCLWDNLSKCN